MADLDNKPAGANAFGAKKPENQETKQEAAAVTGESGPGIVPAYGNQPGGLDNNVQITDNEAIESNKRGSEAQSQLAGDGEPFDLAAAEAAQAAGDELPEGMENSIQYSSHPIARFAVGHHEFSNGLLTFSGENAAEEAAKFEAILATADQRTQHTVKKIDRAGGAAVAKAFKAQQSKNVQGIDTTAHGQQSPKPSLS